MLRIITTAVIGGALMLGACGDPVSDEARAEGEAQRAALTQCLEAAGFTVAESSPAPAGGGNRSGPGGSAWNDGALQAPDGTWLDLYHWSEWADDPEHAPSVARHQAELFNESNPEYYGPARAVGSRAYVVVGSEEPYLSDALDACLMMP